MLHDGKLTIFERFREDKNLPKFKVEENSGRGFTVNFDDSTENQRDSLMMRYEHPQNFFSRILRRKPKEDFISVEDFFRSIKATKSIDMELYEKRLDGLMTLLDSAKTHGQKALAERLAEDIHTIKNESQLYAMGYTRVLDEEQVVQLAKKAKRGIKLDWIANFTRIIPSDILKNKAELISLSSLITMQ